MGNILYTAFRNNSPTNTPNTFYFKVGLLYIEKHISNTPVLLDLNFHVRLIVK